MLFILMLFFCALKNTSWQPIIEVLLPQEPNSQERNSVKRELEVKKL